MHKGKEIVLIKKPIRDKLTWYFYYYHTDDGVHFNRSNRYSCGLDVDQSNLAKSERQAMKYAIHIKFDKEKIRKAHATNDNFYKYTENWFIPGKCPYLSSEEQRGKTFSRNTNLIRRRVLKSYITPAFKNFKLSEIKTSDIEKWMFKMSNSGLTGSTINLYYSVLQSILGEATRLGDLNFNPTVNVKRMAEDKLQREILTMTEFKTLYNETSLHEVWDDRIIPYTMTLLAATCGLRMGEIQAIQSKYVNFEKLEINICHSWDREGGLSTTKTKKSRIVPITKKIAYYMSLCDQASESDFIFSTKDKPVNQKTAGNNFARALSKIGIDDVKRKERGLTFHSLRHLANSYFNDNMDQSLTMKVIGHSSKNMNEHYDHVSTERLNKIRDVMEVMGK